MSKTINFTNRIDKCSTVITFGNFDGIHLGHVNLIKLVIKKAKEYKAKSLLITFNPHTQCIIQDKKNHFLTSHNMKLNLLKRNKLDYIVTLDFNKKFSKIYPSDFIEILISKYNPKLIILGYDNKFGYKGEGDYEFLCTYLKGRDIDVIKYKPCKRFGRVIKSSIIKQMILSGDINNANKYLGRYYELEGTIIEGNKQGKKIGYPTANIDLNDKQQIIPKVGVYSVNFIIGNTKYKALCNIGYRPTFEKNGLLSIESFILSENNFDLYGKNVYIEFIDYIRNEKKFISKEELIKQIETDIKIQYN